MIEDERERRVNEAKDWLWRQVMDNGRVMSDRDVKDFFAGWDICRAASN